eukprot:scaffold155169_cov31-Attheya_sp.AAC.2
MGCPSSSCEKVVMASSSDCATSGLVILSLVSRDVLFVEKSRTSSSGMTAPTSSTNAIKLVMLPCPSSPRSPLFFRAVAFLRSFVSTDFRMTFRTRAARMGLSGQPCVNPSTWEQNPHSPSG